LRGHDWLVWHRDALLSRRRHLGLPNKKDVKNGVIAYKIAATPPTSPKGHPGARIRHALSKARFEFRWKINSTSRSTRKSHAQYTTNTLPQEGAKLAHFCSMCGPFFHFCSMKITQDVREYAAQKEIDEQAALVWG